MLTRRGFLQLIVGGAVGTIFSPLPWRMADEMVLCTQWWTPQGPSGKESWDYAWCQLGSEAVGLKVRKIDERIVKLEGNPLDPVGRGSISPLTAASLQLFYGPTRIEGPKRRVGDKGKGEFEDIEWPSALGTLTERLKELRDIGKAHTVACIDGRGRGIMSGLINRFCKAYGTPNYLQMPSSDEATSLAISLMQGHQGRTGFDLERADYILSFGSQLFEGWGTPARMMAAYRYLKEDPLSPKAKIVQFEPRLSHTAAKADEWLPIKPGTEAALALGLAYIIIKEGLYNKSFVGGKSFGFESFKRLVSEKYSPEDVADITGLEKEDIIRIAHEFSSAKRPLAVWGRGKGDIPSGLYEVMAIHSLNALVGNINRNGGVVSFKDISDTFWGDIPLDEVAKSGQRIERIDEAGTERYPLTANLAYRFAENVISGHYYPINVLMIFEANPCHSLPRPDIVEKALEKIPLVVTFNSFIDETSLFSDLILPNHFYLEAWQDVTTPSCLQYPVFGVSGPVSKPLCNTQHTGDIFLKMAQGLGGTVASALSWQDFEGLLKDVAKKVYGTGKGMIVENAISKPWDTKVNPNYETFDEMWEKLLKSIWFNPNVRLEDFKTPTGKFEFSPKKLEELKLVALPQFIPWEVKGVQEDFPLLLVPYEKLMISNGYVGNPPYMMKALEDTTLKHNDMFVEVHPYTATSLMISEGDLVLLKTPFGSARVRVHLYEGIMPGIVAIPLGLGHTAYDEYSKGKGINAYKIVGISEEKATGMATWAVTRANLIKIERKVSHETRTHT